MKTKLAIPYVGMCLTIFAQSTWALDLKQIIGASTSFNSPTGRAELCIKANHLVPEAYKADDTKDEDQLCSYNFYSNMALCPKLNSTNPGTLVTEIMTGKTREQTMAQCHSDAVKVEAKFKNSISCSYAPSILSYYHFSRMLKAGNVPAAVLRTMDKSEHSKVVVRALDILKNRQTEVIYKTWKSFSNAHVAGTNMNLFDSSRQYVYGALVDNPKKEYNYKEVSGSGVYETRYERFLVQPPYVKVANPAPLSTITDTSDYKKSLQTVVQMKDVSDMVLLDTLLNQDDRIGNIHYKAAWYQVDTNPETGKVSFKRQGSKAELSSDLKSWVIPEKEKVIQQGGAILVKEILLKDNDCGVDVNTRSNMMRKKSALEGVRHMSARTYKKFIELYKLSRTPAFSAWMTKELQLTAADLGTPAAASGRSILANINKAYSILNANCKNGTLKLDLNVDDLIPGNAPEKVACD